MPVLNGLLIGGLFGNHVRLGSGNGRVQFLQVAVNAVQPGIQRHDAGLLGEMVQLLLGLFQVDLGPVDLQHEEIPGDAGGLEPLLHLPANEIFNECVDDHKG